MSIKNRDGTLFGLRKPNPIMKEQEVWNGFKLHNFVADEENIQKSNEFENLSEIETEEIKVEVKETPIPEIKPKKPKQIKNINLVKVYCLPATLTEAIDEVYGDKKVNITYGQQFQFECEILEVDDLTCKIKTNLTSVESQSIIFSPQERRWWKVTATEHNNKGLLLTCVPSNINPSFSI